MLLVIGACVLAYVVNEQLGTNYMFLAKPANNNVLLQLALAITGPLYPVAVTLWQAYVSYFMAGWFYKKCLKNASLLLIKPNNKSDISSQPFPCPLLHQTQKLNAP